MLLDVRPILHEPGKHLDFRFQLDLSDVELALDALGEVTGRVVKDDVTNRIFERFCVGK